MASTTARRAALALAGVAAAGAAIVGAAGTAQAAAPAAHTSTVGSGWYGWDGDEDSVVAVFQSYRQCAWAAQVGQYRGYWNTASCDFIQTGYRGGWRSQWGSNFSRYWDGDQWCYRGVWVLRADVD